MFYIYVLRFDATIPLVEYQGLAVDPTIPLVEYEGLAVDPPKCIVSFDNAAVARIMILRYTTLLELLNHCMLCYVIYYYIILKQKLSYMCGMLYFATGCTESM